MRLRDRHAWREVSSLLKGQHVVGRVRLIDVRDVDRRRAVSDLIEHPEPVSAGPDSADRPSEHHAGDRTVDVGERGVTILIPVYNAFDDLVRCIDSVRRNTTWPATLLLVDDASTDVRVAPYLTQLAASNERILVERNSENLGFVRTVNIGFGLRPDDDILILNSDTEVPPRWLESMALALWDPDVATVTALSNNAGAFSAPVAGEDNPLPAPIDVVGRAVSHASRRLRPVVVTGNGFCMLIRREAIDQLDGFDEENFGAGYCEENDFCLRARSAGWKHLVEDSVLVAHRGSGSFGPAKAEQLARNRARLDELHPDYNGLVQEFLLDNRMAAARDRVAVGLACVSENGPPRPRVLFVLHYGGGGTPHTNLDLMSGVSKRYEPILLTCNGSEIVVTDGVSGGLIERIELPAPLGLTTYTDRDYAQAVERVLVDLSIELVHVRHLLGHTHDLPMIAARLNIPVVVSLHDYYFVCPTTQLLDNESRYCAGVCTSGGGICSTSPELTGTPHLKHNYVHEWRRRSAQVLATADAYVTTTDAAADVLSAHFPDITPRLKVIEHGRDLEQIESVAARPDPGEPFRILVPGTIGVHKGAKLIEAIAELDVDQRLEFHLIGSMTRTVQVPRLVDHGRYERDQFATLAAEIRPSATAVMSVWAETYSHTVTESWSVGVPVIGSNLGAVAERIRKRGGGWIIDPNDAEGAYATILRVLTDEGEWERQRAAATITGLPSALYMSSRYMDLYAEATDRRRVLASGSVEEEQADG